MDFQKYAIGEITGVKLGLVTTIFLTGFIGIILLPFYVYFFGAGIFWEFFGVMLCIHVVWNVEAYRLMRYARKSGCIFSLPGYFSRRFGGKGDYLRVFASCEIVIFTLVIMGFILKEFGIIMNAITGFDGNVISVVFIIVISLYIGIGGFSALARTCKLKAVYILLAMGLIGLYMFTREDIHVLIRNMMKTDITGSVSEYLSVLYHDGDPLQPGDYVSLISMGLLASGMPFMITSIFASADSRVITRGKNMSVVFATLIFLVCAFMGCISRGYLYPEKITNSVSNYIKLIFDKLRSGEGLGDYVAVLYLGVIIVAFITVIEASINNIVVIIFEDILNKGRLVRIDKRHQKEILVSISMIMGVFIYLVSLYLKDAKVSYLIIYIATLGCSISPVVFVSLCWKRMTKAGCAAGLIAGLVSVPVFKFVGFITSDGESKTLCDILGINSIVPSMATAVLAIVVVSLLTKKPDEAIVDEFLEVRNRIMT